MLASILINNYNYAQYLDYCISSALNQTYKNIEIILYNDGSSDNSLEIANKYKNNIIILSNKNFGKYPSYNQANAINMAYELSKGEIIFLLDSDDAFYPEKVERVMDVFIKHPEVVLVQHKFDEINFNNQKLKNKKLSIKKVQIKKYIEKTHNLTGLFSQTSALSFRRSYFEQVVPLKEDNYKYIWPDVRLTRQSIFYGEIYTIYESLGEYRIHENNDSNKLENKNHYKELITQMYQYFNEISRSHNGVLLDLNKAMIKPEYNIFKKLYILITCKEKIKYKIFYLIESINRIFIK